jgi:glycosyltransferase involved in cell wall biosynthesis
VLWVGQSVEGGGLPRVVLEALAAGKATVASAVSEVRWLPAIAEHVEPVEPGDAGALAAAIARFVESPTASLRRASAGRELMIRRATDEAGTPLGAILPVIGSD